MKTARFFAILIMMSILLASVGCAPQPAATTAPAPTAPPAPTVGPVATAQPTQAPSVPQTKQKLVIWTNLTAEAQTKVLTK